jgi:hypothetical protein
MSNLTLARQWAHQINELGAPVTDSEAENILSNLSNSPVTWLDRVADMRGTFCDLMREGHSPADSCILAWISAWSGLQQYCPKIETLRKAPTLLGSRNVPARLTDAQYAALESDIEKAVSQHGQGALDAEQKQTLSGKYRTPVTQIERLARDARRRFGIRHPKQKTTVGVAA